ncbi:MAG: hypothetical protein IKO27_09370 [Ruminococcus sp.]|nr:hypothetical protein [Ruminococcus sp.]
MKKRISHLILMAVLLVVCTGLTFSVGAVYAERSNDAKKAVLDSAMMQAQSFYPELSSMLDNAAVYSTCSISKDQLLSVKDLNSIRDVDVKWFVDVDKIIEITLLEKDGEFNVVGSTLPPEPGDDYAITRMEPSDTAALLKKYSKENGYETKAVSISELHDTRLLLISGDSGLKAALLRGREDFCNMKLGDVMDLEDAIENLKGLYQVNTPSENGLPVYGGVPQFPDSPEISSATKSDEPSILSIVMISCFGVFTITATVIIVLKKKRIK